MIVFMRWVVKKVIDFAEKNRGVLLVLVVVALLRIPSVYEPNRYGDEDIYLTLGMGLRKGLAFYRDIHDNKPPLLYLVAAMSGSVAWFRFWLMMWNGINIVVVNKLAKRLMANRLAIFLTTLLFGVLSSIPLTEGNIANGEVFMILPTTAGVWLFLSKKRRDFWVGVLLAVAFLFKVPVAFELVAMAVWLGFYRIKEWKRIGSVCLGFAFPVLGSILYYWMIGAGEAYIKSALMQNVGYLSSWERREVVPIYKNGLLIRGLIWAGTMAVVFWQRKKLSEKFGLVVLWMGGALFGALLSGRPYPHYMIEVLPPLVLMMGMIISKFSVRKVIIAGMYVSFGIMSLFYYKYWLYPTVGYYGNFVQYELGRKSEKEYRDWFGRGTDRNYQIAEYIRKSTFPNEKIFVWGNEPAIYVLADRLPVGRYVVAYHVYDFRGQGETMAAIATQQPKMVVTFVGQGEDFVPLWEQLESTYIKTFVVEDGIVWMRKDTNK